MPPTLDGLPDEVQVAFFIYALLPDRWDGMSGSYLGKDWAPLNTLYGIYDIEDQQVVTMFIAEIQGIFSKEINEKNQEKRKAAERKSSAGSGKKFAHNVKSNG
jgi:hypothetical protein